VPVENLDAMTLERGIVVPENQTPNCHSAVETAPTGNKHEMREQLKLLERSSRQTGGGPKHVLNTSDEYPSSSGRSRRTGNQSSRGRVVRHTGASAVPVREKPKARSGGSQKLEVAQVPFRNDNQQMGANQSVGPTIARTIYTSDRWTRSGGEQAAEHSGSSNTVALTVTTGFFAFNITFNICR